MILKKSNFAGCLLILTLVSGMFAAHASETPNKTSQPAATEKTEKVTTKKAATEKATKSEKTAKININTATAKMLETLKNIGPKKAKAIIKYRKDNGLFKSLEDLKKIPGIGDKTFEKNRHQITIGQPAQKTPAQKTPAQKIQPKANTEKSPKKPATTDKSGKSGTDKSGKSEKPGKNKAPVNNTPDKKAASPASKNQNVAQPPKVKPL